MGLGDKKECLVLAEGGSTMETLLDISLYPVSVTPSPLSTITFVSFIDSVAQTFSNMNIGH